MLRDRIGLDSASIGTALIQRTIRQRMRSLGLNEVKDYKSVLDGSKEEWNELVEAVVVPETWFFRDHEPFAALVRLMREEWLPSYPSGTARLLSLPCASGEEPYSIVMALRDAEIPPGRFRVDAVDLSARALAHAERGVYRRNSFRGKELGFRSRYFSTVEDGFLLSPWIRGCVRFHQGNLFSPEFPAGEGVYDFIFCRNLLIYFDPPTQVKALQRIERLLAPRGVLFVGPAEQTLLTDHGFVPAQIPLAFAGRKTRPEPNRGPARLRLASPPAPLSKDSWLAAREVTGDSQPRPVRAAASEISGLAAARQMADLGRLDEAARLCQLELKTNGPSAQAYYLLGLVSDAQGNDGAIDYYRKALYLEPDHYESLLHMASLLLKNGDSTRARNFLNRAGRLRPETEKPAES